MDSDPALEQSASSRFGSYEVLRQLGSGASGSVYLARREGEQRTWALKVLGVTLSATARERFQREAEVLSRLDHPGLARCLEAGLDASRNAPFLVLEYVHGKPLEQIAAQPLAAADAARLVADLADAVGYAHGKGVLHRDIKPENVVVREADGRPVLVDFGLARNLDAPLAETSEGDLIGTPHYMAPEQVEADAKVDERTDVYALGAVLYRLLTGQPPFDGANLLELCERIQRGGPVPPRRLNASVPGWLERVCLQALAVSPSERFPTAHALARALRGPQDFVPARRGPSRRAWLVLALLMLLALPLGWLAAGLLGDSARPGPGPGSPTPPPPSASPTAQDEAHEEALLDALDAEPGELDPYLALARFRLERGDTAGTARILEQAGGLPTDLRPLQPLRDRLEEARAGERDIVQRSLRLLEHFEPAAALELLQRNLEGRPGSSAMHIVAAKTLVLFAAYAQALEHLERAFLLDPSLAEDPKLSDLQRSALAGKAAGDTQGPSNPVWGSWIPSLGGAWALQPGGWLAAQGEGLGPFQLATVAWHEVPEGPRWQASVEVDLGTDPKAFAGIQLSAETPDEAYLVYVFADHEAFAREGGLEALRAFRERFGHDPSLVRVARLAHGEWLHLDTQLVPFDRARPVRLRVEADGHRLSAVINDQPAGSWEVERDLIGRVGLLKFYDASVRFRGFELRSGP